MIKQSSKEHKQFILVRSFLTYIQSSGSPWDFQSTNPQVFNRADLQPYTLGFTTHGFTQQPTVFTGSLRTKQVSGNTCNLTNSPLLAARVQPFTIKGFYTMFTQWTDSDKHLRSRNSLMNSLSKNITMKAQWVENIISLREHFTIKHREEMWCPWFKSYFLFPSSSS